jgi:hypothetical protein
VWFLCNNIKYIGEKSHCTAVLRALGRLRLFSEAHKERVWRHHCNGAKENLPADNPAILPIEGQGLERSVPNLERKLL